MSTQTRLMTADEFLEMPDDGLLHELVRGEIVTMSLPGGEHGEVAGEFFRLIANHVKSLKLGKTYAAETGFIIERDPDTVRGPDAAFVRSDRLREITNRKKYVPFAPDQAVEVLSPDDRPDSVEEKVQEWLAAGSRMVWTVDPGARTVTVHRPGAEPVTFTEDQDLDGSDVLPGFVCRVALFFS
jgi:Uma2 family endonuclease